MVDYRPVYSNKKRLGIALLALLAVIIGFFLAVGIGFGLGGAIGFIVGAIILLSSVGIARAIHWMAFHGRRPEWSDVPDR